jgi:hypothetical protein
MACRPAYQPQLPQTWCGRFEAPQRGQRLRADSVTFHAEARRLRVFDFDIFFLGTGMTRILEFEEGRDQNPADARR